MADYLHADDGKIHTRYSELVRCTGRSIERVLAERFDNAQRFENASMLFGTDRHEMWAEEGEKTKKIPACFSECIAEPLELSHVEQEFATELLPGVIVHSRPDAVAAKQATIIDYKTAIEPEDGDWRKIRIQYSNSKQLKFYAYQLGINGIRITRGLYLIEVWNRNRDEILGYMLVEQRYKFFGLAQVLPWVKERIAMLVACVEARELAQVTASPPILHSEPIEP